jgi:aryl-alcohol dehydrogenase-like predicted oxidoreductase
MKEKQNMQCKLCGRRTGVSVSERALGTGMFGKTWGYDAEPDEVYRILQGAVEVGGTCIATADSSQHGAFETLIGACVALNRHDFPSLRTTVAVPRRIQRWSCLTTAVRHGCTRSPLIINTHSHTKEMRMTERR